MDEVGEGIKLPLPFCRMPYRHSVVRITRAYFIRNSYEVSLLLGLPRPISPYMSSTFSYIYMSSTFIPHSLIISHPTPYYIKQ